MCRKNDGIFNLHSRMNKEKSITPNYISEVLKVKLVEEMV